MSTPMATPSLSERLDVAHLGLRTARRLRRRRYAVVTSALTAAVLALTFAALTAGPGDFTVAEVLQAIFSADPGRADFTVNEVRLPRFLLGVLVGIAFALAGALFQSVLRNPLASPDIVGVSQGASAGAVAALLGAGVTGVPVSLAALGGGLAVGVVLYAVAWRGGLTGHRFVLAGIGVAYVCAAVVGYLLTRSDVDQAQTALQWLAGSLSQNTWPLVSVLAVALLMLVPLVALVARPLQTLTLGDDQAAGLGARPELSRFAVIALGVALASVATAAAGPVAFVAFVSAPVARRMLGDGRLALLPAALVGVVMVVGADLVAQFLLPADLRVPTGVVTGVVGGPYLIWLLATGRRRAES
ncbi:iron chelate uptake ABC transporter family permease subunit [Nocardioides sp. C4-1]|uniref:FecCD family ABC transporter permease n=1 Tax=Nocardioides sp. C4-1 TaxID=3151851 RepID=UPI003265274D